MEIIIFLISVAFVIFFLFNWYKSIVSSWPPNRAKQSRFILGFLPVVAAAALLYILLNFADEFVRNDSFYLLFYLCLSFVWLFFGMLFFKMAFDISHSSDTIHKDNKATLLPIVGGFIALAAIYAGANIGDGPGWWCVILSGMLGLAVFYFLGKVLHWTTDICENVTVDRDRAAGIRLGAYFIAIGIILARAVSGDWTSFSQTIIEFLDCWPVVVITFVTIMIELFAAPRFGKFSSALFGLFIITGAIVSVIYMPSVVDWLV